MVWGYVHDIQCKFPCKGVAAIADGIVGTCAEMVILQPPACHLHSVVGGNTLAVLAVFLWRTAYHMNGLQNAEGRRTEEDAPRWGRMR